MSLKGISHKLMKKNRDINREAIFALNRKYKHQLLYKAQHQYFNASTNIPSNQCATFIDPSHQTIIKTFARMTYSRADIKDLIQMMQDENILKVYKGVIGLSSFQPNLINMENQLDILGVGTVRILTSLIYYDEHPFIRLKGVHILRKIVQQASRQAFHAYFIAQRFPQQIFIEALSDHENIISVQAINLLQKLEQRNYTISTSNYNLSFLAHIEQFIITWLGQPNKIGRVFTLLTQLRIHLSSKLFANRFYKIMNEILSIFIKNDESKLVNKVVKYASNKQQLNAIMNEGSHELSTGLNELRIFIKRIINLPSKMSLDTNSYTYFIQSLLTIQSNQFITRIDLFHLLSQWLISQSNTKHTHQWFLAKVCLKIFPQLLDTNDKKVHEHIIRNEVFFQHLAKIYKIPEKEIVRLLNEIVMCFLRSPCRDYYQQVKNHSFISLCIKHSYAYGVITFRNALSSLKSILEGLKFQSFMLQSMLKKLILDQNNIDIIRQALYQDQREVVDNICIYFIKMWESQNCRAEEKTIQIYDVDLIQISD